MIEMRANIVLKDTGALNAGQRYQLNDGIEAALVREGKAVRVKAAQVPQNKAQNAPRNK